MTVGTIPFRVPLESPEISAALKEQIGKLAQEVSREFHNDLFQLLRQFRPDDLQMFADLWSSITTRMQSAFVAFIIMGDDPDGEFLKYLDTNAKCQEAVDMAFAAHIDSLRDLGKSLSEAEQAVSMTKSEQSMAQSEEIATILSSAEKAEEALEIVEKAIGGEDANSPVHDQLQAARSALEDTTRGLRGLAIAATAMRSASESWPV
jgi:hypothetical protein